MKRDVIIIGAGASGLMCAIEAGKRDRSVLVLEHAEKIGKKIRVSGGGRCNFTNIDLHAEKYISQNPHFCKSALSRFTPQDFIEILEKEGIRYYEKEAGQLFCSRSSGDIVAMIQEETNRAGVEILTNCRIEVVKKDGSFTVTTNLGIFESDSLVIATGGISYPQLGATDIGHKIAKQFGIKVTATRPGLVPFIFTPEDLKMSEELSGISFSAEVGCGGHLFRGEILFTHKGLSGPAVLQASSYWNPGNEISINLMPDIDAPELLMSIRHEKQEMKNFLAGYLPRRFALKWCELYVQSKPLNQYSDKELKIIGVQVNNWIIKPAGTEGYKTAEVTLGGIDTDELSSKTMEAKKVPGLYFIGEVIDVTGQLGGYNLHWAWASGFAAGQYV